MSHPFLIANQSPVATALVSVVFSLVGSIKVYSFDLRLLPGRATSPALGNRAGSGRSPFRVFTSQVVSPMCPNFPHRGHILPTFRTGLGRKKPARLPRNSVIIICIGGRVDQGPLGCREGLAVRCANRVAATRYIPSLAFESIPRRHSRIPAHPARLSKKTEPNEGPEPTSLLVRPLS